MMVHQSHSCHIHISCNYIIIGVSVVIDSIPITINAIVVYGVYDLPAKSDILGTVHFKAKYPCTRCMHPGKIITTNNGYLTYIIAFFNYTQTGGNVRIFPHSMFNEDSEIVTNGCGQLRSFIDNIRSLSQDSSFNPVNKLYLLYILSCIIGSWNKQHIINDFFSTL